jgi:hypothetical protein
MISYSAANIPHSISSKRLRNNFYKITLLKFAKYFKLNKER